MKNKTHRGFVGFIALLVVVSVLVLGSVYVINMKNKATMKAQNAVQVADNNRTAPTQAITASDNSNTAIDAKIKDLNADSANVDSSFSDKPVDVMSQ